ncbi:MAG: hypothetical protein IJS85_02940 [Clostridiales bacterium]|nr:hypothetical protein [Clostridiales bacterium]
MELKTRSKRTGDNREIDVFYEETEGFSEHINDKSVYKMVFVREGSFVVEEDDGFRLVNAPVGIIMNERAEFKVSSRTGVKTLTTFFKPTFIREEFTFDAINSKAFDDRTD